MKAKPSRSMLVTAFLAGALAIRSGSTAHAQADCNPPCAAGQVCVQAVCMVPAPPPQAGYPPPPSASIPPGPQPGGGYPPAPGYQQPPAGYQAPGGMQPGPGGYPPPPPGSGYMAPPANYYSGQGYPPPPPQANLHDGFYLRLHLGAGYMRFSGEDPVNGKIVIHGSGPSLGVALGATLTPNFVVFGTLFLALASEPSGTLNGADLGNSHGSADVSGFGAGAAYYIQPVNVYVSAALAATRFEVDDANGASVYRSKAGVGIQTMVGKEWWVSREWGLGIAGEFIAASMKDDVDSSFTWTATTFSVLFSATYN